MSAGVVFAVWALLSAARLEAAQVEGSLDACWEGEVPWTDVKNAIYGYLGGQVAADRITRLKMLALEGGLDPQNCDCWFGWISLRFFVPLILEPVERATVLGNQLFHTEWLLWLGAPWIEMLESPWDVPAVLARTAAVVEKQELGASFSCSSLQSRLLAYVEADGVAAGTAPTVSSLVTAVEVLLQLPTGVLSADAGDSWSGWSQVCDGHAAVAAALMLGIAGSGFRVTPGYAFRLAQKVLSSTGASGLLAFLSSPWPLAQLLQQLAQRLVIDRARDPQVAEDQLASDVVEASRTEFPGVHASFLPPVTRRERLLLLQTLAATHSMLTAAQVPYLAITGTALGAMRHHGFVPWDGDADVCADIRDELWLLKVALLQGSAENGTAVSEAENGAKENVWDSTSPISRAAALLTTGGFELFAHADKPLTFKLSGQAFPRVPGRPYGYPYVDVWFCHGWAGGEFSLQSAGFGVPMPRSLVFPRRKVFFAGLPLWSFNDARAALSRYYNDADWFSECVGHATFHRQERKFSEKLESERFQGHLPCSDLAGHHAFASAPIPGLPEGVSSDILLHRINTRLLLAGRNIKWELDPDGPDSEDAREDTTTPAEAWRQMRDEVAGVAPPLLSLGSRDRIEVNTLDHSSTTRLVGRDGTTIHLLTEASMRLHQPLGGRCDVLLRWRFVEQGQGLDTAGPAELSTGPFQAAVVGGQILELGNGRALLLEMPSCICRCRLGALRLQWVAESPS